MPARQNAGMSLQAPPGHPARGRFFRCYGRSPGSQVVIVPRLPNACRISDLRLGNNSLLTVAGAAPDSRGLARSPASLLATMSWVMMDRNDYIWCDLNKRVNGARSSRAKFLAPAVEACEQPQPRVDTIDRVDAYAALPISDRVGRRGARIAGGDGLIVQSHDANRHCERSEAIHSATRREMDCFLAALLAMTAASPFTPTISERWWARREVRLCPPYGTISTVWHAGSSGSRTSIQTRRRRRRRP